MEVYFDYWRSITSDYKNLRNALTLRSEQKQQWKQGKAELKGLLRLNKNRWEFPAVEIYLLDPLTILHSMGIFEDCWNTYGTAVSGFLNDSQEFLFEKNWMLSFLTFDAIHESSS